MLYIYIKEKHMAQTDIFTDINQQRQKGYTDDIIRANLLTAGHTWPEIDSAFSHVPPPPPTTALSPAKPKKHLPFLKIMLVFIILSLIGTGGYYAYQYYRSFQPSDGKEQLPPESESRQYIHQVTTQVLDHVSQGQYHEALSYFHYQKQNPVFDESILTSLAVIKTNYQQTDGTLNYQLAPEDIIINGETAEVTVYLLKNGQPHPLYFDFHYSHWYITDIRFESQLDYLSLSHSESVVQELYGRTQFQKFLPSYNLVTPDLLTINLITPDTSPPSLSFNIANQPQQPYLISIFELPDQQTHIPVITGQPFNYSHVLTTQSYGVIYVFSSFQDPTDTDIILEQLTPADHRLRLTFQVP